MLTGLENLLSEYAPETKTFHPARSFCRKTPCGALQGMEKPHQRKRLLRSALVSGKKNSLPSGTSERKNDSDRALGSKAGAGSGNPIRLAGFPLPAGGFRRSQAGCQPLYQRPAGTGFTESGFLLRDCQEDGCMLNEFAMTLPFQQLQISQLLFPRSHALRQCR